MQRLERWATTLHVCVLFLLGRLAVVDIPFRHLLNRRGEPLGAVPPAGATLATSQVEFLWADQEAASAFTDSMVKQLLALSSGLATILFTFLSGAQPILRNSAIAAVLVSALFCLQILGVRRASVPKLPTSTGVGADQEWAGAMAEATRYNRGSHAHRVDLYRVSRRWFMLALILASLAGILRQNAHAFGPQARSACDLKERASVGTVRPSSNVPVIRVLRRAAPDTGGTGYSRITRTSAP